MRYKLKTLIALVVVVLTGCSALKPITSQNIDQVVEEFSTGKVVLRDSLFTLKIYLENRGVMHALYGSGDWMSLAKLVIQVDFANDLNWFYLGRSAEGLGFYKAAKIYYLQAASSNHKCNNPTTGDECAGLHFPSDIVSRLNGLPAGR